jgi:hypothetical protein
MGNTCENLAEDGRNEYLTACVVQEKDGSRLWEDFDAYQDEENSSLSVKSRFEVMLWIQGLESNFLENTPEQTALRSIAQDRLARALKDARDRDEEETVGETPVDDDEVPKKKSTRRKKKDDAPAAEKPTSKKRGRPRKKKVVPVEETPTEEPPKDE